MTPDLPVEILIDIMHLVGDWELANAIGIPTLLPQPSDWEWATQTDRAVITGHLPTIRKALLSADNELTEAGTWLIIRFGYVNVLEYFLSQHHEMFLGAFVWDLIPTRASRYGRLNVLSWWKHALERHPDLIPLQESITDAVESASRYGHVDVLDWWLNWGHTFEYTDRALGYASANHHIGVLEWFKRQHELTGLPLETGRAMKMASTEGHVEVLEWWARSQLDPKYDHYALSNASAHGKVEVLQWWLGSGLPLAFNHQVLIRATENNWPEVLEWWDKSGLAIDYTLYHIMRALNESPESLDAARAWWSQKGVDFNVDFEESLKLRSLN